MPFVAPTFKGLEIFPYEPRIVPPSSQLYESDNKKDPINNKNKKFLIQKISYL
jgi:hypothetical protein